MVIRTIFITRENLVKKSEHTAQIFDISIYAQKVFYELRVFLYFPLHFFLFFL